MFREVKACANNQNLGITGGSTLRPIIFILLESGMALFSIQLIRLVVTLLPVNLYSAVFIYDLTVFIHEMLTVIIRSVIVTFYFTDNIGLAIRV